MSLAKAWNATTTTANKKIYIERLATVGHTDLTSELRANYGLSVIRLILHDYISAEKEKNKCI